jgi:hypothetical protein
MTIDLINERVVTLTDATRHLPTRRGGKRPAPSTLFRWAGSGLRGVRLETLRVGGTLCTSLEALERFFRALSDHPSTSGSEPDPVPARTPARRRREIEAADRRLAEMGV